MREKTSLVSLNRGIVSRFALARIDLKRIALAAEVMTNWLPKVLGPMILRPGRGYVTNTLTNLACRYLKFIFATNDTALIELTPLLLRVLINDAVLTRLAVSTVVTNGTFATDLTGWTDNDEAGATSTWVAPHYMQLVGNTTTRAIRDQQVTCLTPNVEHALRVVIARGPVVMRVGTAQDDDSYVKETTLLTGTHSLAFTPTGDFWIRFESSALQVVWVSNCTIEAAGVVTLPTPWTASDLSNIRYDQSADVLFLACAGFQQRRIERRGTHPNGRSWSMTLYSSPDGPFDIENINTSKSLTGSAIVGNITVTASQPTFKATHVGALFAITTQGQAATANIVAENTFTHSIRVTGGGDARIFQITVSGTWSATVSLERSYDNLTWVIVTDRQYIANVDQAYGDDQDNQIIYYRLGIATGNYVSGTAVCTLSYAAGSQRGVVRVTDFTNATTVGAEVLATLGATTSTTNWQEGMWSDQRGWPTSGQFHEGRLWWAGQNGIWGSVSDAFDSFDETFLGDAGPINRTIGSGPVDTINWVLSMRGLLLGSQGSELSARSSSLDEPLTPTNFNVKKPSTQGSSAVSAVKVDQQGYFVHRNGVKLFELAFDVRLYDYASTDLMALVPELGIPGIVRMDAQRQPDTRIHCVRSDGTVVVLVLDKGEDVMAWVMVSSPSAFIEDVVTLPAIAGNLDDQVYYVVRRTVNGSTVRYLEKWAQEVDCRGDKQLCHLADAYLDFTFGSPTSVVTGLGIFEGLQVVVWADGFDVGTNDSTRPWALIYTVTGGQITLAVPATNVTVGLPAVAQFKSTKLGEITQAGSPLNQQKKVTKMGIVAADLHPKGIKFGPTFDETGRLRMDDMPSIEDGAPVGTAMRTAYDENLIPFPGTWTTDGRVCIQGQFPRPAAILGITPDLEAY